MSKTILGLDLGTNSIGWALMEKDIHYQKIKMAITEYAIAQIIPTAYSLVVNRLSDTKLKNN